ncbi:hypothetical protein GCM10010123_12780 [Pilimelia anulata]|uniref:ATP-grasp domain-containing protein n=1 Tax=Pilimelia anulata TaxID=53371 RepID=A0A8J3B8X0_9ACTN|nr:hypothetical protein [Pilimelia anulata]GGJ84592.1 hypothetical protein GCM10010123_12780 [Pilimelia anulata]
MDFRADYASLTYRVVPTPPEVAAGVAAFLAHFGLAFGALDFAVDRRGRWWFLECNPAGQVGFIEDATGLPITSAIADTLMEGGA